jgi:molybdopterin-binding protein
MREGDLLLAKQGALSIRNGLPGTITGLRPGTVTTELTLDTGSGELYALLARSTADEMKLNVGQRVKALLRERDFLILSTT